VILALVVVSSFLTLGLFDFLGRGGFFGGSGDGGQPGGMADCPFLSDGEAREVLGGNADAILLEGLAEAMVFVIDTRALPNDRDCWITDGQRAYIARVAVHQGGDAGQVFQSERQDAQPVVVDQGGGLSTTTEGYYGGAVEGLGDEAFCTGLSAAIMGGVLVRQGDRVVYATVGSSGEGVSPGDFQAPPEPDNAPVSPGLCTLAQELARKVLD
jgi:hypothetical protein